MKYQAFAQTLQQSRGFGSEFQFSEASGTAAVGFDPFAAPVRQAWMMKMTCIVRPSLIESCWLRKLILYTLFYFLLYASISMLDGNENFHGLFNRLFGKMELLHFMDKLFSSQTSCRGSLCSFMDC